MEQIIEVQMWFNKKNGKWQEQEILGAPYILAKKNVTVEIERVAFFDCSGSQCPKNIEYYLAKAKAMGIKKYAFFSTTVIGNIRLIKDFAPEECRGATSLSWLDSIDKNIIPIIFIDNIQDVPQVRFDTGGKMYMFTDNLSYGKTRPFELHVYDTR